MNQITFTISIFFQKMPNLPQKCMNPATLTRVSKTQATTCRHPSQLDNKINVVKLIQIIARIKFRYNSQDITWKKGKMWFLVKLYVWTVLRNLLQEGWYVLCTRPSMYQLNIIPFTRHYNPLLIINLGFTAHISLYY